MNHIDPRYDLTRFLPTSVKEVALRGWEDLDIIIFSGDAYVDHPSFGAAVSSRQPAIKWPLCRNPTGAMTCGTSASWDARNSSSECRPAPWTRW